MDETPESTHVARRAFLKNAARIGFVLPVITTFTMSGIGEPSANYRATSGNQTGGGPWGPWGPWGGSGNQTHGGGFWGPWGPWGPWGGSGNQTHGGW
jgi:hypothetical protein